MPSVAKPERGPDGLYPWPWCCYCGAPLFATDGTAEMHHSRVICSDCRAARHAAQREARALIRRAIRWRIIPPANAAPCADCGKPASLYEHRSYNRPLDVQPVCRSCNIIRGPALWRGDEPVSYESALFAKHIGRNRIPVKF